MGFVPLIDLTPKYPYRPWINRNDAGYVGALNVQDHNLLVPAIGAKFGGKCLYSGAGDPDAYGFELPWWRPRNMDGAETGDLTLECWLLLSGTTSAIPFSAWNYVRESGYWGYGGLELMVQRNPAAGTAYVGLAIGRQRMQAWMDRTNTPYTVRLGYGAFGVLPIAALPADEWAHVAVCRRGGAWSVYLNGTSVPLETFAGASTAPLVLDGLMRFGGRLVVRQDGSGFEQMATPCYLDEVRITNGRAVYTGDFTPPTEAFPNP